MLPVALENRLATPFRLAARALSSLSESTARVPSFWKATPISVSTFMSFAPPACGVVSAWRMRVCRLRSVLSPTSAAAVLVSASYAVSVLAVLCRLL